MFKPLSLLLAWRYLRGAQSSSSPSGQLSMDQSGSIITVYSWISVIGLALGVSALILVSAVLQGFEHEFKQRVLGWVAPVKVSAWATRDWFDWEQALPYLTEHPAVRSYTPFIESPVLLGDLNHSQAGYLLAVDPMLEIANNPVAAEPLLRESLLRLAAVDYSVNPSLEQPLSSQSYAIYAILLGDQLAQRLQVDVGDTLSLYLLTASSPSPSPSPSPSLSASAMIPRSQRVTVVGLLDTKTELDAHLAMLHIAQARTLMGIAGVTGVHLRLADPMQAPMVTHDLRQRWYQYQVQQPTARPLQMVDWTQSYGELYQAIQLPKAVILLLLLLILLVAVFNITTTLQMMVRQKYRELAILQTLGMSAWELGLSFLLQGVLVALMGVGAGLLLGVSIASALPGMVHWFEHRFKITLFAGENYFINYLPVQLDLTSVIAIACIAVLLALLATLLPAWRAARVPPAELLRSSR